MNDNFIFGITEFPALAHRLYFYNTTTFRKLDLFSSSSNRQDSSVGIVTSYRLDCWGAIPGSGNKFFSILVMTGLEPKMGTGSSFPWAKAAGA